MADELYNKDKAIMISNEAPNYWYYSDMDDHRFDRDPRESYGRFIGRRTISRFAFLEPYHLVSVETVKNDLYLVFYQSDYDVDQDMFEPSEPMAIHIVWKQ